LSSSSSSLPSILGRRVPYQFIEILSNGLAQSTLLDVLRHLRSSSTKFTAGVYRRILAQQDIFGRSPLHIAALNNNAGAIALILHELETVSKTSEYSGLLKDALGQTDLFGLTPRQLAVSLGRKSPITLFSKAEDTLGINTANINVLPAAKYLLNAAIGVAPLNRTFNQTLSSRILSYSPHLTLETSDKDIIALDNNSENGGWNIPAYINDDAKDAIEIVQRESKSCDIDVIDFSNDLHANMSLKAIDVLNLYLSTSRPVLFRGLATLWPIRSAWKREILLSRQKMSQSFVITGEIPYANRFGKQSAKITLSQHVNGLLYCTPEMVSGDIPIPDGKGLDAKLCSLYANKTAKVSNYLFQSFNEGLISSDLIDDIVMLPWFLNTHLPLVSNFSMQVNENSGETTQVFQENTSSTKGPHLVQSNPSAPIPQIYIGGPGSGAPFHYHFDAFNMLAWGEKKWFFKSPDSGSEYSTVPAVDYVRYIRRKSQDEFPLECTQHAGDVIFVPSAWGHAVLNIKTSIGFAVEFDSPLHSRY
jgi:hypothetical protein